MATNGHAAKWWADKQEKARKAQSESRLALLDFVKRVRKQGGEFLKGIKSEWFGRPDAELKAWMERGSWLNEVKDTRWHINQVATIDQEISWAQEQLEIGKFPTEELRAYLKALRFVKGHIVTTDRNADMASQVLAYRAQQIGTQTFVSSGANSNDRSRNN